MLRVNKHRLEDELELQAEILDRIGQQMTVMNSRAIEAADDLKREESRIFVEFKDAGNSDKLADVKMRGDAERKAAWIKSQAARSDFEQWQALYDAWKARGYAIKELVSLYSAQYFSKDANANVVRSERPVLPPNRHDYSTDRAQRQVPVEPAPAPQQGLFDSTTRPRRRAVT